MSGGAIHGAGLRSDGHRSGLRAASASAMHQLLAIKQTPRPSGKEVAADHAGD